MIQTPSFFTLITIVPKSLTFHRNGVSGASFYTLVFDWKDSDASGKDFIATFETDTDDRFVKIESCRVLDPSSPTCKWRGDNFASSIWNCLYRISIEENVNFVYDVKNILNSDTEEL